MQHSFALFQSDLKKQYPKIVKWILLDLILIATLFTVTKNHLLSWLLIALVLIISCYIIYFLITNKQRFLFTKGTFIGSLVVTNSKLIWITTEISFKEIDSITFHNHDYLGKYLKNAVLNPSVSIGVNNLIEIKLKNGKIFKSEYQMKHDHELFKIFKILDKHQIPYQWTENS